MRALRSNRTRALPGTILPTVTICVASFNTSAATELCVRSIMRLADQSYSLRIGDSGSTDGSLAMLEGFQKRGLLTLERSVEPRTHADWLDHWRRTCSSEFILFVDSDVEFRRAGWLSRLMAIASSQHPAIAYAEWLPAGLFTLDGRQSPVVARPAPWLLLMDSEQTAELRSSFAVSYVPATPDSSPPIIYDVGASLFYEAVGCGLRTVALPRSYKRHFHHYGGLSWLPLSGPRGEKKARDQRTVKRRLRHLQRLQRHTSMTSHVIATAQLAALPQEVLDTLARIRRGLLRCCGRLAGRRTRGRGGRRTAGRFRHRPARRRR